MKTAIGHFPFPRTWIAGVLALTLTGAAATAGTHVVDRAGGSGAFADVAAALAVAEAGDVVLVRPGVYPAFALDRGVTLLGAGAGQVRFIGTSRISGVARSQRAVLAGFSAGGLSVNASAGFVFIHDVFLGNGFQALDCDDLRLHRVVVFNGTDVGRSRVEAVDCEFTGTSGLSNCGSGGDGEHALTCHDQSRLHFALSTALGGSGGDDFCAIGQGGDGGHGIVVRPAEVELILTGAGQTVRGGNNGLGGFGCTSDGVGGNGLHMMPAAAAEAWSSGVQFHGGDAICSIQDGVPIFLGSGNTFTPLQPDHPTLELLGTPTPGSTLTLRLRAPAGSSARLYLGRTPMVAPLPGVLVESLTDTLRTISLGAVPPSGVVDHQLFIPLTLPAGMLVLAQASSTLQGGHTMLTNSTPFVVQ